MQETGQAVIYFHDALLGACYLKISSYLPFHAEFYFNGHNAIQLQLDKQGIQYRLKDNAFVDVADPGALQKAAQSLNGRAVLNRISYWMDMFFRFEKGKYSTRSKFLEHNWYLSQIALAKELLKPKYHAYGFKTVDLLKNLPQFFQNPAQIRYEMNKLRVHGVVEKKKGMSFYKVTGTG